MYICMYIYTYDHRPKIYCDPFQEQQINGSLEAKVLSLNIM